MKMIGMSARSTATRCCRSRPLSPGRLTSSTRQLGPGTSGRDRNSCADANVSGCQPAQRISNSSDSRTDTSSSTTNTMGVASGMCADLDSPYSQSSVQRPEQRGLAKWLVQTLHRAPSKHAWADGLIAIRGNEHDGDLMPATRQFLLQLGAGHPRHRDVEEQRPGLLDKIRCEKLFRDANAWTSKPNSLSKSGSDSRTDSSSSTIATSEATAITQSSRRRREWQMQTWRPDRHSALPRRAPDWCQ